MAGRSNLESAIIRGKVMQILWEYHEPVPIQELCVMYIARYRESGVYHYLPKLLKAMAADGMVSETSTWRQRSWWKRLGYWLFVYHNSLFLTPFPPDPTARYEALVSRAEMRARYSGWWSNEKE